ncbi:cytokine receptor family member B16 [Girardinichthys multiradiatus]|uniref:cytokine receptor family member B16 n=1 Tax=Girardinichthys multiradiatus TaxID=208333 RepID=UPI001FAE220E|nr:cytokine receptor family member B16 [Girardinichthys multiradiatus]
MMARGTRKLLMMVILLEFTTDIWMLPAPGGVFMDSMDMRHVLRWTQPKSSCNTAVVYVVQYQGEFEFLVKNGSWIIAPECQKIPHTMCDLTFELGSDSDYSLRVRAQCGSELSAWTTFPFNRNNMTPPVPEIKVMTAGDVLLVSVRKFPLTSITRVMMWKEDEEQQAKAHLMPADQEVLQVAALQEGAVYCVKAQVFLNSGMQSGYTDSHCVSITGPGAPAWKEPTTVTLTVIIMLGLLIGLFWSIVHCRPGSCQKYFQKEPLPLSLKGNFDLQITINHQREEYCEETPCLLSSVRGEKT